MRRTTILMTLLASATIIVVMVLMSARRGGEHGYMCGLVYGNKVDGVVRYAFENDNRDSTALERLNDMRAAWLAQDFRLQVFHRACAQCRDIPTNDLMTVVMRTTVEIRPKKISVLIRSVASTTEIASACAQSFAREIIESTIVKGNQCKEAGVAQLRRNYEKQERHVFRLQKELQLVKADASNAETAAVKRLESEIASLRKRLAAMQRDISAVQKVDGWCGFFEEAVTKANAQNEDGSKGED